MSLPDPYEDELEKKEEKMKERTANIIGHVVVFIITVMAGFFGWWNFGFYFGGLIVVLAAFAADSIEKICGQEPAYYLISALLGHIVYWLILAYILRGLWKPFGGIFG